MKTASKITDRRKKDLGYEPLKPGEVRIYQLTRARVKTIPLETKGGIKIVQELTNVPRRQQASSEYVIYDYPDEKKTSQLEPTQVAYYLRHRFGKDNKQVPVIESIFFTKEERGMIRCDYTKRELDAHLFFSPANENNAGKEGYKRPRDGYMFKILDTNKKAEDMVDHEVRASRAINMIVDWDDDFLRQVAEGLSVRQEITLQAEPSLGEIREQLILLARRNPNRVLSLDQDISLKVYAKYREAVKEGILESDGKQITWTDTRTTVCVIPSGISPEEAFKAHVLDHKNKEVLERVEDAIEAKKAVPA